MQRSDPHGTFENHPPDVNADGPGHGFVRHSATLPIVWAEVGHGRKERVVTRCDGSDGGAKGAADHAGEQPVCAKRPVDREEHPHDVMIMTDRVDQMWGTDMTQTVTTVEGRAYVFITVDHCSGELVGSHASSSAGRWEALEPILQGVAKHFGAVKENIAAGLRISHDHGPAYMADDF